ncbi:sigma-B regulation protein RsbU (phosphoserine phosphatase) [Jannaschia faecimaris]|uniref:Sigma-B regulation protein RsbU (Phosphoserine phosphatase) n=1 Tax=Jannaschia faecimaris TaxID=1244108 RepID=A0A1H3IRY4_9RHOB|nr:fused response regulator/phosphatase [Jannaschia faecimaris]SDY30490.1 sigma-B regulation protein RsbU (phosphoserine phosphatase) [Jannaschia faecimaris]
MTFPNAPTAPPPSQDKLRVLVVDDSATQRQLLCSLLSRMDLDVVTVPDAAQALFLCMSDTENPIGMILTDWQMPGMDGPDFCRAFRQLARDDYAYVILMASETDRTRKAVGLEAGADDFVARPLDLAELRARINTGRRILGMQEALQHRNHEVHSTLSELRALHDEMDQDLVEARKLQRAFIPPGTHRFGDSDLSLRLVTSGHIGGDLVGYFQISATRIGLYSIDVSGHGVASALLTGRLSALFSWKSRRANIAFRSNQKDVHRPDQVMKRLNDLMLSEMETDIYFTAVLAYVDTSTGEVLFCQAGHPHPLVRRIDGSVERLGQGGPPVGLLPDMTFDCSTIQLKPGDALLTYSDGLTECANTWGDMLEEEGLMDLLAKIPADTDQAVTAIEAALRAHSGIAEFEDDISMLLFRYGGACAPARGMAAA